MRLSVRGTMVSSIVMGLSVLSLCSSTASLAAPTFGVPHVEIQNGVGTQPGTHYASVWTHKQGRTCRATFADGTPSWTEPLQHPAGEPADIELGLSLKPQRLWINASAGVDPAGPVVPGGRLDYDLWRRDTGKGHVWVARIDPQVVGDTYLDVSVQWPPVKSCGGARTASYTFHLRSF